MDLHVDVDPEQKVTERRRHSAKCIYRQFGFGHSMKHSDTSAEVAVEGTLSFSGL